ncbi:hypothetical protein EGM51_10695 [Verrucomicrobia bacterium S94]|nr:hypothetical protein EGM51_10695 [Verrucomicrobia bacterium S94]
MKKTIVLAACMAAALNLHARLGESEPECDQRYGKAVSEFDGGSVYSTRHYDLICVFRHGLAVAVVYEKRTGRIYDDDKPAILAANADGQQWSKMDIPPVFADRFSGKEIWLRSDDAVAVFDAATGKMSLYLAAYSSHLWGPEDANVDL